MLKFSNSLLLPILAAYIPSTPLVSFAESNSESAAELQQKTERMLDEHIAKSDHTANTKLPAMEYCAGPYEPVFDSDCWKLYQTPKWFRDAKLGVWLHWGPSSVEGKYGWPFNAMYRQDKNEELVEKYGHPSKFGWKDIIPLWKAEKWDPDALTQFFKKAGFRYMIAVACHHDNFDCYASTYQPWNSVNMGPKRDIIGEWKKSCEKYGLKLGVGDHRMWVTLLISALGADAAGAKAGIPYDAARLTGTLWDSTTGKFHHAPPTWKTEGQGTYWEGYDPGELYGPFIDEKGRWTSEFLGKLYLRTKELIDKYKPDLIYFDGGVPPWPDGVGEKIYAHYYNTDLKLHGGRNEWVLNFKSCPMQGAGVVDYEAGMADRIFPWPWTASHTLQPSWFYAGPGCATAKGCIHSLVDVVSKNGNYQINVSLKPDGTLPPDQKEVLERLGQWLAVNGEAIYETRPWKIFGEGGGTVQNGGGGGNCLVLPPGTVRFTSKGDVVYAIVLNAPSAETRIFNLGKSLGWTGYVESPIEKIELLGSDEPVEWTQKTNGLHISKPHHVPFEEALVYRIHFKSRS
jgi:alpha-L-fucosidase